MPGCLFLSHGVAFPPSLLTLTSSPYPFPSLPSISFCLFTPLTFCFLSSNFVALTFLSSLPFLPCCVPPFLTLSLYLPHFLTLVSFLFIFLPYIFLSFNFFAIISTSSFGLFLYTLLSPLALFPSTGSCPSLPHLLSFSFLYFLCPDKLLFLHSAIPLSRFSPFPSSAFRCSFSVPSFSSIIISFNVKSHPPYHVFLFPYPYLSSLICLAFPYLCYPTHLISVFLLYIHPPMITSFDTVPPFPLLIYLLSCLPPHSQPHHSLTFPLLPFPSLPRLSHRTHLCSPSKKR